ncbi:reverse transcriptase domain-containing protein [Tanacetum coccineum]
MCSIPSLMLIPKLNALIAICMLSDNHDLCVLDYINNVNASVKSKSAKKQTKRKVWKPTGKMFTTIGDIWRPTDNETSKPAVTLVYSQKPRNFKTNVPVSKSKVLQSVSANKKEPSKSWGSIISDVLSSSLNECRSSKLSSGNNLYTLSFGDMMASSPICLLSKTSKTKSWLWHRHLSHLNFGAINHLARHGLVRGLPKLKFEKDHLCSACAMVPEPPVRQPSVESSNLEKPDNPPIVTMADNRTMAQLLEAPIENYEDAIVISEITANNFEIKHGLLNLVQNKQFFGNDKEDPHAHIRYFNKITSTMKIPNVPNTSVKLMLFPFSLEGAARIWLEKEPPRSIETWDDLVSKFINKFFPPSKTTNLRNEITRFQQKFDETFYEAWDRFNDLLRGCPHHGFSELHQLDTFYNALNSNDQDSLNSAAGGNFLDKMPRECLKIIESKSKVRQSRNKAVVAKMSTSSSTQAVSSDVAELKDMVRALILDRKNQTPASAPVKAVEQSCVTCGGGHSYQNCPATNSNMYHDNIQEYVSQAAAANFNQANSGYRPPMVSNQIRPPGFPPVQNPHANNQNNFNRGNNFNQNRGNNFNQGQIYRPPVHQPVVNQPVAHQGPAPQTHGVSKTDFERYVTANDAVLRNMQNQGQNLQSQMANLTDMLSKFVTANTASTSGSGTLPGNTVTNPKEDLKGITTRSGVTIQGPKAVNHDTEVTKDTMPPANNGSTEDVQPPVVQIQSRNPNPEPNVAPVVTPVPKASIPFPSRRNDERRKEKANDQIEKFYEIFRDLSFEISFTDALMLMPKFASRFLPSLLRKEEDPLDKNSTSKTGL